MREHTSRRSFLKTASTIGGIAVGATGSVAARPSSETIKLGAYLSGWFPTSGENLARTRNPTLELEAGTRYELQWTNGDGVGHDFIIRNRNGDWVAGTEMGFGTGTTKSFTFTATEEMVSYYCTVHPVQMRGNINVAGRTDKGANATVPDDLSPVRAKSSVTFEEKEVTGKAVTVESTTLPEGGFVVVHTPRLKKRPRTIQDVFKSIVGWSDYLEPGTHENVTVPIEGRGAEYDASKYRKLIAMNHRDTDENQQYDFIDSGAQADWPYFTPRGRPVVDPAKIGGTGN